jgi:hypothetical protein
LPARIVLRFGRVTTFTLCSATCRGMS